MRAGVVDMLGRNVDHLRLLERELELIREPHHRPGLADAVVRVKHEVLSRPPMNPNKDPIAPPFAFACNAALFDRPLYRTRSPKKGDLRLCSVPWILL